MMTWAHGLHAQGAQRAVDPGRDVESFRRAKLADAGYGYDQASFIAALRDQDRQVQVAAAFALATLPPSRAGIDALKLAVRQADLLVVVVACGSLRALGDKGWEDDAAVRMEAAGASDLVGRLELAGILAASGRADGWRHVRQSLTTPLADVATSQIAFFHELRDENGQVIDAVAELDRLRRRGGNAPEDVAVRQRASLEHDALQRRLAANAGLRK